MTDLFIDDPAEFFDHSSHAAHHLPRPEQEALQLQALQRRFAEMRDALPPLKALADTAGIDAIASLADAAPLLFPHSFYKAYPEILLQKNDFPALTRWLSRLTRIDLSPVADRYFPSIDAWFDAIEAETGCIMMHSSGTTGRLSLYPRGKDEVGIHRKYWKMLTPEWVEPLEFSYADMTFAVVWPSYASGRSAIFRMGELCRDVFTPSPEAYYPLIPYAFSADWQYWLMRADAARHQQRVPPTPSDYVATKIAQAQEVERTHAERTQALLDLVRDQLAGRRVLLTGGVHAVHRFAADGVARGMAPGLAKGSAIRVVGGLKNVPAPEDMEATMLRFGGVPQLIDSYGMSELGVGFSMCRNGRFHVPPWILPYVFDVESSAVLPRTGVQRGRAAFFDLPAYTFWGGVISADLIEIDWDLCACGRTTPHIHKDVDRIPAFEGDHLIGPASAAATDAAVASLWP